MTPWLWHLIAFVAGCHGFTCIPFGIVLPDTLKEWKGNSPLLGSAITSARPKVRVLALHVTAGILILAFLLVCAG